MMCSRGERRGGRRGGRMGEEGRWERGGERWGEGWEKPFMCWHWKCQINSVNYENRENSLV